MGELVNCYSLVPKDKSQDKTKGYKKHSIDKNSRILMITSFGTGKRNALIKFCIEVTGGILQIRYM